jgi:hypothetical protein
MTGRYPRRRATSRVPKWRQRAAFVLLGIALLLLAHLLWSRPSASATTPQVHHPLKPIQFDFYNVLPKVTRVCLQFARLEQKPLIFEHRSAAYMAVCEQRSGENQRFMPSLVEL